MRAFCISCIFLFFAFVAQAQYPYINHIEWMMPQFNAAALGVNNSENLLLNYNRSWISNEVNSNLATLQYDRAFLAESGKNLGGIGASISNNKVNYKDQLGRFQAMLGAAYAIRIGKVSYLNFGLQGSYNSDQVSNNGLFTGSQYVPGIGFDPSIGNSEPGINLKADYVGLSTGLILYQETNGTLPDNYLGIAIKNLNRPVNSLFDNDSRLDPQLNVSGGIRLFESLKSKLMAEGLYSNTNNKGNVTVGGVYELRQLGMTGSSGNETSIRILSRYSINNKILVGAQLMYDQYVLGFTYDIKTAATDRSFDSGFEILIGFRRKVKRRKKEILENSEVQEALPPSVESELEEEQEEVEATEPEIVNEDTTAFVHVIEGRTAIGEISGAPPEVNSIYFDFASKEITRISMQHLLQFIAEFYRGEKRMIVVTGYTDHVGNERYNQRLSLKRANSVKEVLLEFGVKGDQIIVEGKGELNPRFPNDTEENRALNRRVEIYFY